VRARQLRGCNNLNLASIPLRRAAILCLVCLLGPSVASAQLRLTTYVSGLSSPVGMVQDPTNASVQFVVEQAGSIRVVQGGVLQSASFLDIRSVVLNGGERGLLGLAFAPDYATSGRFFVNFTNANGHTVIARFVRSSTNALLADAASRFDLQWPSGLRYIEQPFSNHNGGKILFGPDGYLYIGMGDGGSGNDPQHRAQDPNTLLGKMLRIDVNVSDADPKGYRIPADNPFLDGNPISALGEIWAFGLRNPWRFTVDDPARGGTGAILIGDVGQGAWEEIDYEPAAHGGRNYGWRNREGAHDNVTSLPAAYTPLVDPIHEYPRSFGITVIGGSVYRGPALGAAHTGRYFFGDLNGRFASLGLSVNASTGEATSTGVIDHTSELGGTSAVGTLVSIDVDAAGELYLVDLGGRILRLTSISNDADTDGLPDDWERQYGLDPASATGNNGSSGDPDNDGKSNLAELSEGTHPRGFHTRFLAEGALSDFFSTWVGLVNPESAAAAVLLRILSRTGTATQFLSLGALGHRVFDPSTLTGFDRSAFSIAIEADRQIVAERTMTWSAGNRYGSHTEAGVAAASTSWYFAEGATHPGFDLFYLIQNATTSSASVAVTYLRPAPLTPLVKTYAVAPNSRFNIWVDLEDAGLSNTDVSAAISSTVPIAVERAMYRTAGGRVFDAGHAAGAIAAPLASWLLAEGATGDYFDFFILLANPNAIEARVTATYLLPGGTTISKNYVVAGSSRLTIWVDQEDSQLADTAVSTQITSTNGVPIVVERAMWWPGPTSATWHEAHAAGAVSDAGVRWAIAGGEAGRTDSAETYILIANTSPFGGSARVTLLLEDGRQFQKTFALTPTSRTNVSVPGDFADAGNSRFGAIVESLGTQPAQIVVERATYSDAGGVRWAAGASTVGTRLQ
jgi:glucose/arabinose dehydrogenase